MSTRPSSDAWFRSEAASYLAELERTCERDIPAAEEVERSARGLSGAARLAGNDRLARAADAVRRASKSADVTRPELGGRVRDSLEDLGLLAAAGGTGEELDARVEAVLERFRVETRAAGGVRAGSGDPAGFRRFVAAEATAIADTMDRGVGAFTEGPSNREWLGAILRRQRTLLGAARLDEFPVVAEALQAVEDLSELIVRLDVPIKSEWLDVFRSAKEVLRSAAAALDSNEEPSPTPSLSRLRTLRDELLDRYGERLAKVEARGAAPADTPEAAGVGPTVDVRQRAAELRAAVESALGHDEAARAALEELYEILRRALP